MIQFWKSNKNPHNNYNLKIHFCSEESLYLEIGGCYICENRIMTFKKSRTFPETQGLSFFHFNWCWVDLTQLFEILEMLIGRFKFATLFSHKMDHKWNILPSPVAICLCSIMVLCLLQDITLISYIHPSTLMR